MRALLRLGLLGSVAFSTSVGLAAPATSQQASLSRPTRIAPATQVGLDHWREKGALPPLFAPSAVLEQTGRMPVIVSFTRTPSGDELGALERSGVVWRRATEMISGAHLASVDAAGLAALEASPNVARVTPALRVRTPRPLDASAKETGIATARRAIRARDGSLLDGTGTVIGDIDTDVWIFHPSLFRADGGSARWVDVDGDGKLTPDVDGVDLDESGTIEKNEILHVIKSRKVDPYRQKASDFDDAPFAPDVDYLYCDTNGNGARDYGSKAKFTEDTPAYGEPLFVFDDANADGKTEKSERLLRLKTSKIKAVHSGTKTYTRGGKGATALVQYDMGQDPKVLYDMHHATAVAGILVGGVPGVTRHLGLSPGAELIVGAGHDIGTAEELQWALDQGANVLLTEYAPFVGVPLDGSSEDDKIIDAAFNRGVLTVSPAGNLAESNKHRTLQVSPGAPVNVKISALENTADVRYFALSLYHRAPNRTVTLKLTRPNGEVVDLSQPSGTKPISLNDGAAYVTYGETTTRGTAERHFQLYKMSTPLGPGDNTLSVSVDAGAAVEIDMYVVDELNGWGGGYQFDKNDTARTICEPSTADKTISVAAYTLHAGEEAHGSSPQGALASYSSRGPLLDGKSPGIEIAAPDNPYTALPPIYAQGGYASYWAFGGTSGAGPHVAATVALLRQVYPKESAAQIKDRLLNAARHDSQATADALATFGRGKLDAAKAVGVAVADGTPPRVEIAIQGKATTGGGTTFETKVTDDGDASKLMARWDFDYDGTPDTDWEPVGTKHLDTPAAGVVNARVEVRDDQGNLGAATVLVDVVEGKAEAPPAPAAAEDSGCGCRQAPVRTGDVAVVGLAASLLAILFRRRRRA